MKVNVPLMSDEHGRYHHNLTHQVSTTSDFAFCQPVMVNEVEPESINEFRIGEAVFAQPMVKPTFGRIEVKTFNSFVPIPEIWHAFESFLSKQSYHGSGQSYIPLNVPSVRLSTLIWFMRSFGQYNIAEITQDSSFVQNYLSGTYHIRSGASAVAITALSNFRDLLENSFYFPWKDRFGVGSVGANTRCIWNESLQLGSADWYFVFESAVSGTTGKWIVFGRLGTFGKNLLKILEGCGYSISVTDEFKSILPLVAYYKAWFDLFIPDRDKTWKDSAAFSLMEYVEQTGEWNTLLPTDSEIQSRLLAFLELLPQCYYTQNPDYAAAHIRGNRNSIAADESLSYMEYNNNMQSVAASVSRGQATPQSGTIESSAAIRMLDILSRRVNIRSVSGGRIDVILRSIYGADYLDETKSNYIGSTSFELTISEIMNHAETTEGYLGQYAGAGKLAESGDKFTYKNIGNFSSFGYIVSLLTIVPKSNMCQGQDMQVNRRFASDFYARDVDSSTLVPTPKANIFGESDYGGYVSGSNFDKVYDAGFGNIPVYFEYKFKKNTLSGEFRMRSTRDSMLPFTLDKLLPYTDVKDVPSTSQTGFGDIVIHNLSPNLLVAGSDWRYLGLHPWLGQFNRIFVNSGDASAPNVAFDTARYQYYDRIDDNFVVDLYIDYDKTSPALPIADSWQTDAYGEKLTVDLS